ncbi:Uncharacterised protein [Enterococcus durans]|uniref:Uncharacterized protein n=1 Tax=Enterococcus durans TaxID=53345 RepID=A0A377KHV0_9ENTE|nr:Uncharacterised protein [Enterococcus durans]
MIKRTLDKMQYLNDFELLFYQGFFFSESKSVGEG